MEPIDSATAARYIAGLPKTFDEPHWKQWYIPGVYLINWIRGEWFIHRSER